jgi:predicted secreted protein
MSATAGRNGQITVQLPTADLGTTYGSAVIVGQMRSWSLDDTAETLDTTVMSGTASGFIFRDTIPSFKTWTITVDFIYDRADSATADAKFKAGNNAVVAIYPEGNNTATDVAISGTGLITSLSRSASYDGLIECSVTFEGKSALSYSTTS